MRAYDGSGTVADDLGVAELAEDEALPSRRNYDRTNEVTTLMTHPKNLLMSRRMLSYMPKFTRDLFQLAVLCDSLRCGAYGTYCYGIL